MQILLNVTQPVLPNGQLHWALNNIASYKTPDCKPLLNDLYDERANYLSAKQVSQANETIDYSLVQTANDSEQPQVSKGGTSLSTTQVYGGRCTYWVW